MHPNFEIGSKKQPAVFFDRDGTLMDEVCYCADPADVRVLPGMRDALIRLRAAGWFAFLITNQSGIARGKISLADYQAVHRELLRQLGSQLDASYYCSDLEGPRRKPDIGMILEATADFPVDIARSFFVGDRTVDIECGRRAGMRTILVETGYGLEHQNCGADWRCRNAVEAVDRILEGNIH
jgi:D-glycero-D-manno-heptose 1,7-bisphosphate phosphatase